MLGAGPPGLRHDPPAVCVGSAAALAALALRDTDERIIDVAARRGFSSQEELTRAFRAQFGCTPAAYRREPSPIPLPVREAVFDFSRYQAMPQGGISIKENGLYEAHVRMEYIPAHSYLGVFDDGARD